jgi:hypothetical protein
MSHKKKHKQLVSADSVKTPVKEPIKVLVQTPVKADLIVKKDTTNFPSLFKNHLLEVKTPESKIHFTKYDYVVSGILFFSFTLFIWIYVSNRKRLNQIIKSFYINRNTNQLSREEMSVGNSVSIFLSILFVFTLTLFIVQLLTYYGLINSVNNVVLFSIITSLIIIAYSIKIITIKILGSVFETSKATNDYISTIFLFANTLGLFLLPIVICLAFVKQISPLVFIYSGIGILAFFLLMRLIKGFIIGLNGSHTSKFYLFIYLCTLEILPFVLMVKLFMLEIK